MSDALSNSEHVAIGQVPLASRRLVTSLIGDGGFPWLIAVPLHRMIVHDATTRVEWTLNERVDALELKIHVFACATAVRSQH